MDLDNGKTTNGSLTFKVSTQHIVSSISSLEEKNTAGFSASNSQTGLHSFGPIGSHGRRQVSKEQDTVVS